MRSEEGMRILPCLSGTVSTAPPTKNRRKVLSFLSTLETEESFSSIRAQSSAG